MQCLLIRMCLINGRNVFSVMYSNITLEKSYIEKIFVTYSYTVYLKLHF